MDLIISIISDLTGAVMRLCYNITGSYGISLVVFTLLTKVFLFPVNILLQHNSIKMVKMQPQLDEIKIQYHDDKERLAEEQLALYKKNHYHSSLGIIPLVFQLIMVTGLLGAVYHPMTYLLDIDAADTEVLYEWLADDMGVTDAGNTAQLEIIRLLSEGSTPPENVSSGAISRIRSFDLEFCGINLGVRPSLKGNYIQMAVPVLAGLSALAMCIVQNMINILQITAPKWNRYGVTLSMIAFSAYFAYLVPAGVGIYWFCGNLFAIPNMLFINAVSPPGRYIDVAQLRRTQKSKLEREAYLRRFSRKEKEDYKRFFAVGDMQLVFYSESNGFYKYFAGYIDYICEHSDIQIHYVTSDPGDDIFNDGREQIHAYYIASDRYLIPLFMKLECDMCVMTISDLEKYHVKRSRVRKDIEYVRVPHGMDSGNLTARKGAIDAFDTVFCTGRYGIDEIREAETLYGVKKKTLVEVGYPLLDKMIADYESGKHKANDPQKILIAPSWQQDNITALCADTLIEKLSDAGYDVIFRPHPQQVKHTPELFDEFRLRYKDRKNVEIQTDFSSNSAVFEADLLITDWSGIFMEYAFTTKHPVIFINTPMKIMNPDYDKMKTVPINIELREVVGKSVDLDSTDSIDNIAKDILSRRRDYEQTITDTMNEKIFNIGKSGMVGGRYIIRSLKARNRQG